MRTREGNKERAILEAAIAVFADHGYHGARVSAIARRAGVATGSVYLYFPNKEAILLRIFDDLWSWLSHQLTEALREWRSAPASEDPAIHQPRLVVDIFQHSIPHRQCTWINTKNSHQCSPLPQEAGCRGIRRSGPSTELLYHSV